MTVWFIGLGVAWFMLLNWEFAVYPKRVDKGYLGQLQRKLLIRLFLNRMSMSQLLRLGMWRMFLMDMLCFVLVMTPFSWILLFGLPLVGFDPGGGYFFLAYIIRIFDDILNGEDDAWKKRWDSVKNKVKWKWTPAMEPASTRLGS